MTVMTIDFEPAEVAFYSLLYGYPLLPQATHTYVEGGLVLLTDGHGFVVHSAHDDFSLFNNSGIGIVYLHSTTSNPFDVFSIDLDARPDNAGTSTTFSFVGTTAGGQTLSTSFSTDAVAGLETFVFPSSFTELTELRWTTSGSTNWGIFDNLQFDAVPTTFFSGSVERDILAGSNESDLFLLSQGDPYFRGSVDRAIGRQGNDVFYFGANFEFDAVDGGEGEDSVLLQGNYAQVTALRLFDIENVVLLPGSDTSYGDVGSNSYTYNLHPGDSLPAARTLSVDGNALRAGETLTFQGGDETGGHFELIGGSADDLLAGGAGNDVLVGNLGNDMLVGGIGTDAMDGGLGDDTFYVDSQSDSVIELSGEGTDRVAASASYFLALTAEIELLEFANLSSAAPHDLGGSHFANTIHGNAGLNFLYGNGGNDALWGFAGDDWLVGGTGADVLWGGAGNDTYYIDQAGDLIYELAGEGYDRVAPSLDYTLPDNAEVELVEAVNLTDTVAMNLGGSSHDNTVYGNNGVNFLFGYGGNDALWGFGGDDYLIGGSGNDAMQGGLGNDVYYVDSTGDLVYELAGEGADRVAAETTLVLPDNADIELLEAVNLSATTAMNLTGSDTANTIVGNAGVNTLDGKGGSDALWGQGGADTFAFTSALGAGNVDAIGDFQAGTDKIALDDAIFTGLAAGALPAGALRIGSAAADADDRIVYDSATGALFYDADGNGAGAAVQFAVLNAGLGLSASDFTVI